MTRTAAASGLAAAGSVVAIAEGVACGPGPIRRGGSSRITAHRAAKPNRTATAQPATGASDRADGDV
jgi:hypothetical protein